MLAIYNSAAFSTASGLALAPNATITVKRESDAGLASIFADEAGTTPLANPFNANSVGAFSFYAAGIARGYWVRSQFNAEIVDARNQAVGTGAQYDASTYGSGLMNAATAAAARGLLQSAVSSRAINTILASADVGTEIVATASFTQTLTAAATLGSGWYCFYKNEASDIVTLDPNGAELIDGVATLVVPPGQSLMIVCTGAGFKTFFKQPLLRGFKDGLILSTAGASATFSISPGVAMDSLGALAITLASALSKTTSAWAVGSGNGGLDLGTIAVSKWYYPYLMVRPDTGVVDAIISQAPGTSLAGATMTIATPAVVTWANHGLEAGARVVFTTTGALPTGVTPSTDYFVIAAGLSQNSFQFSATQGGAAVNTSGTQSGTHTATSAVKLPANYVFARRIGALLTDGASQWRKFGHNADDTFIWDALTGFADYNAATTGTAAILSTIKVPPGFPVGALLVMSSQNAATSACYTLVTDPVRTDEAPNAAVANYGDGGSIAGTFYNSAQLEVRSAAGLIRHRHSISSANRQFELATRGWRDYMGRNA